MDGVIAREKPSGRPGKPTKPETGGSLAAAQPRSGSEARPDAAKKPQRFLRVLDWLCHHAVVLFFLWALWQSFIYFALGSASYVKIIDTGNGTLPARIHLAHEFARGELGNWLPLGACGSDRVLNGYRLELHNLIFAVVPGWLGYGLIIFAQRFVAGYFFFRLMRDDLNGSVYAAAIAGLFYSLFNQLGIHWQWDGFTLYDGFGVPALPFYFWALHRLHERSGLWTYAAAGGIGLLLALVAHYFQALFFPFLILFWITLIKRTLDRKVFVLLACMAAGWLVVQAPQMYGAYLYSPLSHRGDIVVTSKSLYVKHIENVERLPKVLYRENKFYVAIAILALVLTRFKDRRVTWTILFMLLILGFVQKYFFFCDHLFAHLGFLSAFHFHRMLYLLPFLIALSIGLGIGCVPLEMPVVLGDWRGKVVPLLALIAAGHLAYRSGDMNEDRYKNMARGESFTVLYEHPDVKALAATKTEEPEFRVACVVDAWRPDLGVRESSKWTFAPGYAWNYGLETADGYMVMYSRRYKQFWSQVLAPLLSEDRERYWQHEHWGNMVYLWTPSTGMIAEPFAKMYDLDLLSLANVRYVLSPSRLKDKNLVLLPSDIREDLIYRKQFKISQRLRAMLAEKPAWQPLYIYENRLVLPRYNLAGAARVAANADETLTALRETPAADFRHTAIVNRQDLPASVDVAKLGGVGGDVKVVSKQADRIELDVRSDGATILSAANSYSPYWKAEIDGKETDVFPVNHAFQGVCVEPGEHKVVFRYRPPYALY